MDRLFIIRISAAAGIFTVFAVLEAVFPGLERNYSRKLRWTGNISIILINNLVTLVMAPLLPYAAALKAETAGGGLFYLFSIPFVPAVILGIILLDLLVYWQHRLFHIIPLFRPLHSMHHTEQDLDVSSSLRFHPFEIAVSILLKTGLVLLLGIPPVAVLIFEIILNGMAAFNHANLVLPVRLDRVLRLLLVTPDMHRIHHSILAVERNSNYGFNISFWDRIFRSYTPQSIMPWGQFIMGLDTKRGRWYHTPWGLLLTPFSRRNADAG